MGVAPSSALLAHTELPLESVNETNNPAARPVHFPMHRVDARQ